MKKFKFTLQTVHNLREMREEKEKLVLGELQAEVNKANDHVAQLRRMRLDAIENYARRLKGGEQISPMEMELNSNHFASLNYLLQEGERKLEIKKQACQRQGKTVAAAMREVKITDRLRETQKERHHKEMERQEQNNLDEIVSANFARQMLQTK